VDFNARVRIRIGAWIFQKPASHAYTQRIGYCIHKEVFVVVASDVLTPDSDGELRALGLPVPWPSGLAGRWRGQFI